MRIAEITIPRITADTLAQLENIAPGITSFRHVQIVANEEDAVKLAIRQTNDVKGYNDRIGGVEDVTETATGWDIKLRVLEYLNEH